jgi:hypothetical protein
MIKGCQREMIVLQTKESPLFESAYFVLRRGKKEAPRADMLAESNRIIEEGRDYLFRRRGQKRQGSRFWLGFCLGAALLGTVMLIILL